MAIKRHTFGPRHGDTCETANIRNIKNVIKCTHSLPPDTGIHAHANIENLKYWHIKEHILAL